MHLRSKRTVTTIHIQRCSHGESSHAGNSFATVVSHIPLVHLYTCITVAAYLYPCIPVYPVYLYSCTCIRTCTNTCITHVLKHMYYTYLYTSRNRSHGRKRARAGYHRDGKERGHSRHHPHSTVHLRSKRTVTTVHIQRCSHGESSHAGNSFATVVSHIPLVHLYTCIIVAAYLYPCILE